MSPPAVRMPIRFIVVLVRGGRSSGRRAGSRRGQATARLRVVTTSPRTICRRLRSLDLAVDADHPVGDEGLGLAAVPTQPASFRTWVRLIGRSPTFSRSASAMADSLVRTSPTDSTRFTLANRRRPKRVGDCLNPARPTSRRLRAGPEIGEGFAERSHRAGPNGIEPAREQSAHQGPRRTLAELGGRLRTIGMGRAQTPGRLPARTRPGPSPRGRRRGSGPTGPPRPARRPPGRRRGRSSGSRPGRTGNPASCPWRRALASWYAKFFPCRSGPKTQEVRTVSCASPSASARASSASSLDWP